jgi:glycosyltransferase involved in cell wall biosynthesis
MQSGVPLVSVLIITFNHEKYIEKCLESIFSQDYSNLEILIRDDLSVDNTRSIIIKYLKQSEQRVTKVHVDFYEENIGVVRSLNRLLTQVKGSFFCLCSGDDFYHPGRIKRQVEVLSGLPDSFGVVYGDLTVVDFNGQVTFPSFYEWHLCGKYPPCGDIFHEFIWSNPIHPMSVMVRKSLMDVVGKFDENLIFEDWDMGMRWARISQFFYHGNFVGSYRKHNGQMTDLFWTNPEKYSGILRSSFSLLEKHLDLDSYRNEILRSLSGVLLEQITNKSVPWKEGVRNAFVILKRRINIRFLSITLLAFFNFWNISPVMLNKIKPAISKKVHVK